MLRMMRGLAVVTAICFGVLTSESALAQTAPVFQGVTFPKRDAGCAKQVGEGAAAVLEMRGCEHTYPYLSATILDPGNGTADWDLERTTKDFADEMDAPGGGETFARAIAPIYGACEKLSLTVDRYAIPGIRGVAVITKMRCSKDSVTQDVDFRNYTTYAQTLSGVLWCVTFDYPDTPLSNDDKAMIRAAAKSIATTP